IAELVPPPQLVDGEVAIGRTIPRGALPPVPLRSTPRGALPPALSAEPAAGAELVAPSHLAVGSQTFPRLAVDATSGVPPIAAPGREPRAIVWLDADRAQ